MQWFSAQTLMTCPLSISITCSCDLRKPLICFCTGGPSMCTMESWGAEVCRPAAKRLCEWACRRSMQAPENPIRSQRHLLPWLRPLLAVLPKATSFSLSTLSFSQILSYQFQGKLEIGNYCKFCDAGRNNKRRERSGQKATRSRGQTVHGKIGKASLFSTVKKVENELRPHIMTKQSFLCCSSGDLSHWTFELEALTEDK